MEQLFLVGPFDTQIQDALRAELPENITLQTVTRMEEYPRLAQADYIILRTLRINACHMPLLKKARLIQRWGVGFDTVDIQAAGACGIPVAITAGANSTPVSEMVMLLLLAVYRRLIPLHTGIVSGVWDRERFVPVSHTVERKKAGVVGMGAIGKKVARLLKAFGAEVCYYDVYPLSAQQEEELGIKRVSLEELLRSSQIVSLHTPLTDDTRDLICEKTLSWMRPDAVLINTAREEIVNLQDLANALREKRILGAGLDAIDQSLISNNPFAGLDNVVFSPHIGGNTIDNSEIMIQRCLTNLRTIQGNGHIAPPDLVNGKYLCERKMN